MDNANLRLILSKCEFLKPQLKYLGHVISADGVAPDPDKTKTIREMKQPESVTEVRQFLGLANYYRRHIQNFAEIAVPLTKLTRKNCRFQCSDEAQKSF